MLSCSSCEMLAINGVPCHELGCPDAWRDSSRECKNCGCDFVPENAGQIFCERSCAADYYGWPEE